MESLNDFFNRSEFACKCGCGFDTVDARLLHVVTAVRKHFESPVSINSACRCAKHNANVGGSPRSQHLFARAADIVVKGVSPKEVHAFLDGYMDKKNFSGGLGLYSTFVHVDTRLGTKPRWEG